MPKYNKSIIGGLDDFLSEEDPLTKVREDIRKNITGESKKDSTKEKMVSEDVLIDYTDENKTETNSSETNSTEKKNKTNLIEEEVNNIIDENAVEDDSNNNDNLTNNNVDTEIPSIECATVDKKEAKTYTPPKQTQKKKEKSCFCC